MKVSLFTLVFRDRSIDESIRLAKEIGYDGVELWGREPHISAGTTKERAREIRRMLDEYGLKIPSIGSYIGGFSTMSDEECKKTYEDLKKYLNIMGVLKCNLIRVGCGGPNAFLAQNYHYEKASYWIDKCADLAAQYKCRIAMEIHNGSLIETVEAADSFIKKVKRDNVGFILDPGNMYITGTDYGAKSVDILGNKIFHVHVKDELRVKDDSMPGTFHDRTKDGDEIFQQKMLGEGAVDHLPLFKALIKSGYNGFLSNECHAAVPDIERAKHDLIEIKNQLKIAGKDAEADKHA
ncbi:MAG: sugar phosphate isomerase/epimerase [Clostridiales bacterium]|nr:sugar phosphate isomerase/epimerase [Clostridiales bacterium]